MWGRPKWVPCGTVEVICPKRPAAFQGFSETPTHTSRCPVTSRGSQ